MTQAGKLMMPQPVTDKKEINRKRIREIVKSLLEQKVIDEWQTEDCQPAGSGANRAQRIPHRQRQQNDISADEDFFCRRTWDQVHHSRQNQVPKPVWIGPAAQLVIFAKARAVGLPVFAKN